MAKKKSYCTQNGGDCKTCSLVNYGRDCMNVPLKRTLGDLLTDIEAAEAEGRPFIPGEDGGRK